MSELLPQMSWFDSQRLYWLLIVPPLILLIAFAYRRVARRLQLAQVGVGPDNGQWQLRRSISWIKGLCFALALVCLVISSAGPRLGWTWIESRQSGLDMVVAVDVSKSMLAQDLDPSRLEQARRMIIDLLDVAPGDRIGLVVFAGAAFVQCPLTVDHGALRLFLDTLSTDMIPVGGTDVAGALKESLRALEAGGEDQGLGKLIILLTDGEEHQGNLEAAIADVVKSKAKVITVGMASAAGSPIADPQGGFIKDQQGNVVVSRLMEEPLKEIAAKTGGEYLRASDAGASITKLYQDIIRAKGTVRETQARKERLWFERFQWTAFLALVFMVIEMLLSDVRWTARRVNHLAIIGLLGLVAVSSREARAGNAERQRYNEAVEAFNAGESDKARQIFDELVEAASGEEKRRSLYNLGNILAASGQFDEAVKRYEAALAMNTQDQQVRDNLAWARRKSDAQSKDKNKDQNQKQDESQNQNKDQKQENKDQQNDQQQDGKSGDQKQKDQQQKKDSSEQDKKNQENEQKSSEKDQAKQDQKNKQSDKQQAKQDAAQQDTEPMTPEEAEKLLRAAPDDRKAMMPIYRGEKLPPRSVNKDW